MPAHKQISAQVAVPAGQEETFDAVTDWDSQQKWIYATKVRGVGSDSRALGGKLEAFTGIGPLGFLDTMTITKWDPPRLCEVTHTGKVVKGTGLFEVRREDDLTYFVWTENVIVGLGIVGRIGWFFVAPLARLGLSISLKRFKKQL